MKSPNIWPRDIDHRMEMNFISIDVIDTLMVLVIEEHSTNEQVCLFHSLLQRLYLQGIFNIDDVLVGILESQLISIGVGMVLHWLPIFCQQRWDTWGDTVSHWIILF